VSLPYDDAGVTGHAELISFSEDDFRIVDVFLFLIPSFL